MPPKTARLLALLIQLVLAGALPALPPSGSAAAQAPAPQFVSARRVLVYADPHPSTLRVPAPALPAGPRPNASTIVVEFAAAGTPDPFGYNTTCQTFPANTEAAFQYAANIWAGLLLIRVPVRVQACWAPMGVNSGILGGAGPSSLVGGFQGQPVASTLYPLALANQLAGTDLNGSGYEIAAEFNSDFLYWYFGTDGMGGPGRWDFASVVLHELGHGLGFLGSMSGPTTGPQTYSNPPFIYDRFTENGAGTPLLNLGSGSAALSAALTSAAYFNGPKADAANGGARVALYSPPTWDQGSSYSHLALSFDNTPNALMTYSLANGEVVHAPGPVTLGILGDEGWPGAPLPPTNLAAAAVSGSEIDLSWTDNSAGLAAFEIQRSTDGAAWSLAASTGPGVMAYPDTGLLTGTRTYYRVRAVNAGMASAYSNTASAITSGPPQPPGSLSALAVGETSILLTWKAQSNIATGYQIERSDGVWHTIATPSANATSFTDTNLLGNTLYSYRVTTQSPQGPSAPAGPVSATTWAKTYYMDLPLVAR